MKSYLRLALISASVSLAACGSSSTTPSSSTAATLTAGTAIVVSAVTDTGFTLTWGAATDTGAAASTLQYAVYVSSTHTLNTVGNAEGNGTLEMSFSTATLTANVSGLANSTSYSIAVVVQDSSSNTAIYTATQSTLCVGKRVYLVDVTNGNLGGVTGADATCDSNLPSGVASAKAMLTDPSRLACNEASGACQNSSTGQLNWVLSGAGNLCSVGYTTLLGTVNADDAPNFTAELSSTATPTFTGFDVDIGYNGGGSCSNWASAASTGNGGVANTPGMGMLYGTFVNCGSAGAIICVQRSPRGPAGSFSEFVRLKTILMDCISSYWFEPDEMISRA